MNPVEEKKKNNANKKKNVNLSSKHKILIKKSNWQDTQTNSVKKLKLNVNLHIEMAKITTIFKFNNA
jgi:hypothetical protein